MGTLFDRKEEEKRKVESPIFIKPELTFLLLLIKDSQFEGKDVQLVYTVAMKLQEILNKT